MTNKLIFQTSVVPQNWEAVLILNDTPNKFHEENEFTGTQKKKKKALPDL